MEAIRRCLEEDASLPSLALIAIADMELERKLRDLNEHVDNQSIMDTSDILILLIHSKINAATHSSFILRMVQTALHSFIAMEASQQLSWVCSITASCLIIELMHNDGSLERQPREGDFLSIITSIIASLVILSTNISSEMTIHYVTRDFLQYTSHELMAISRQGDVAIISNVKMKKVALKLEFLSVPDYLTAGWSRGLISIVKSAVIRCWAVLRLEVDDACAALNAILERFCRLSRSAFRKDLIVTLPPGHLQTLHAISVLLSPHRTSILDDEVIAGPFTLNDTSFILLYRTSCDLIQSPQESLQTYGMTILFQLINLASSALLLSVTPDIHTFLLDTLKCVSQQPLLEFLTVRCFSAVLICTSSSNSSTKFTNQMLQSIQSTIKLHRKPVLAEPFIIALNLFLGVVDPALLTYNADVLTDIYLSCLNMWSLPLQKSALIGLPIIVRRSQTDLLRRFIIIMMGELIRVFEFYTSGYTDLTNAPRSEIQEVLEDVLEVGRSIYSFNPQSLSKLFAALEGSSNAVEKFLQEVKSEPVIAKGPHSEGTSEQ